MNGLPLLANGAVIAMALLIYLAILVAVIAGMWKMFEKAGQPGWGCIVPIYNLLLLLRIAGRPDWWIILCLIPYLNCIFFIIIYLDIAKNFGRSALFGIGLIFLSPIFIPILGFGDSTYQPQTQTQE